MTTTAGQDCQGTTTTEQAHVIVDRRSVATALPIRDSERRSYTVAVTGLSRLTGRREEVRLGRTLSVEMADYIATNRANWDDRVPIHVASTFYDVERWLRERPRPRERELEVLGEVAGLDMVHLQCHFGLDTLAFANAGARVTGLDFSGAAIAEARSLAERAGLADRARFVEADVLQALRHRLCESRRALLASQR